LQIQEFLRTKKKWSVHTVTSELNKAIDRADGFLLQWSVRLSIFAVFVMLATPAFAVELFRYRGAAKDGGTLEYVFETDRQDVPATATKEKAAEIAAEFMTTFYHVQIGALETQELRTTPVPFWLVCFSDTVTGRCASCSSWSSSQTARGWTHCGETAVGDWCKNFGWPVWPRHRVLNSGWRLPDKKKWLTFCVEFTYKTHMTPVELQGKAEVKSASRGEIRLSLVVSPELNEKLEGLAKSSHSTKSDVLRRAIALFDLASQAKQKDQKVGILNQDDQVVKEIVGIWPVAKNPLEDLGDFKGPEYDVRIESNEEASARRIESAKDAEHKRRVHIIVLGFALAMVAVIFLGCIYEFATGSVDDKKWAGAVVASICASFLTYVAQRQV
jgi:hypothetical protein